MIEVKDGAAREAYAIDEIVECIETVGDLVRAVDARAFASSGRAASPRRSSAKDATFLSRKRRFRGDECDLDVRAMVAECKGGVFKVMMVRSATRDDRDARAGAGGTSRGIEALRASRLAKAAHAAKTSLSSVNITDTHHLNAMEARQKAWQATGIVGLRGNALADIPAEVYAMGARVRVLDVASNALESLPSTLGFVNMTRLVLRDNVLTAPPWSAFDSLLSLVYLDLSGNAIESLPGNDRDVVSPSPSFGALESLSLARNKLKCVPDEFFAGAPKLRHLSIANNDVEELFPRAPPPALEYLDASSNRIRRIPETFASLNRLQSLVLDRNAIDVQGVPSAVLRSAESLVELSLHNNPVKLDGLRDVDGWPAFDARRKARANKALESHVMLGSSVFDEGADNKRFVRH